MVMDFFAGPAPLSETELDRLQELLGDCPSAMNLEKMDGFFCALIAGPDAVLPGEYLPEVLGDTEHASFENLEEANEMLSLVMRHWNEIAGTLAKGDVHWPLLLEGGDGVARGNDWAFGFMEGVRLRDEGWKALFDDDDHAVCLVPALMLYHEYDEDPETRTKPPITPKQREKVIAEMAAGVTFAYRYFREASKGGARIPSAMPRQSRRKIGRNEPCPCGSGKKYKRCCGGAAIQ